ncbi:protein FAM229A isoform X2 [Gallus gallus]|uniref:protein FAM229A isoform X2 n=1 Tax=Gallus gallus TaxID=9031 RepID=UPI001F032BEE|nr:protein FAM229A isoform X2 [Gallus gallus]
MKRVTAPPGRGEWAVLSTRSVGTVSRGAHGVEDCGVGTAGAPSVPLPLCLGRIGARLKGFRNRRSENALLLQGGDPGAVCAPQLCRAVPLPSCCGPTSELSAFGSSSACSPTGPRSFASGRQRTAPLSPGPTVLCWPGPALQLTSLTAASPRAETSGPGHELPGSAAGPKVPHRGRRLSQCGRSFGVTAAGGHCMDCGQAAAAMPRQPLPDAAPRPH